MLWGLLEFVPRMCCEITIFPFLALTAMKKKDEAEKARVKFEIAAIEEFAFSFFS
jgi:hypothetical protein